MNALDHKANSMGANRLQLLEARLNDFDPAARAEALRELAAMAQRKECPLAPAGDAVNLHMHTFFSYNAQGNSPTALAWLARRLGFWAAGVVDFDVLDGVDEFLAACDSLDVRGCAGIETRAFLSEFSDREINSPGEPGVCYHMGIGFASGAAPGEAAEILAGMRRRAEERNREMVRRLNAHLATVAVDYAADVLPLTPNGNATERHILEAYGKAVARTVRDPVPFWAAQLNLPADQVAAQMADAPKFQNLIRARWMKRGGIAYLTPGPETFPAVEDVNRMILACGAIPCATWLNGVSAGEKSPEELLALHVRLGAAALNIIPDRNWNIPDAAARRAGVQNLYRVAAAAQELALPLIAGTEMNSPGQKLVDDFDAPELAPLKSAFREGAAFLHGHTMLQRARTLGCSSAWAQSHFPARRERNAFYRQVGERAPQGCAIIRQMRALPANPAPEQVLSGMH